MNNGEWLIPGRPIPQADPTRDWSKATDEERGIEFDRLQQEYWGEAYTNAKMAKVYRIWQKDENGEYQVVKGNY
jgi:hypothetical protein